ncbi:MAG: cytochrome d ubiquinol oxidase subunit II [Pseudomonadota bacterium]
MDPVSLSVAFLVFALALYLLLDGFDLGVGALLFTTSDETLRDRMIMSIAPTWDGNETWLIMAGVTLLAAFPIAYGVLLPALYLPLIAMLLCLGLRGVSFEFRANTRGVARARWSIVFALGSTVAAFCQGIVAGALVEGIEVSGTQFDGSPLDAFTPFTLAVGAATVAGYAALGTGWCLFKGDAPLLEHARRLRGTVLAFAGLAFVVCLWSARAEPRVLSAWLDHSLLLGAAAIVFLAAVTIAFRWAAMRSDLSIFLMIVAAFGCALLGLGLVIFPYIVPFAITFREAASPTNSHVFLLTGAIFVTPIVLGYSAFAYWIFRGKTSEQGYE